MPRVLVIDDDMNVRSAMLIALRANGFEATGAEDGAAGMREFHASRYDLAIVDIYMPGIDGVQFIKALRKDAPHLPVIAISGVMLRETPRTALDFFSQLPALSNVACLQKPFRTSELLQAIHAAYTLAAA